MVPMVPRLLGVLANGPHAPPTSWSPRKWSRTNVSSDRSVWIQDAYFLNGQVSLNPPKSRRVEVIARSPVLTVSPVNVIPLNCKCNTNRKCNTNQP